MSDLGWLREISEREKRPATVACLNNSVPVLFPLSMFRNPPHNFVDNCNSGGDGTSGIECVFRVMTCNFIFVASLLLIQSLIGCSGLFELQDTALRPHSDHVDM